MMTILFLQSVTTSPRYILSDVLGKPVKSLAFRVVLDFLDYGTITVVSDHYGNIVSPQTYKEIFGHGFCNFLGLPFFRQKHCYCMSSVRDFIHSFSFVVSMNTTCFLNIHIWKPWHLMLTERWRLPLVSNNLSSLLAPSIHTFLYSVTSMSYRLFVRFIRREHRVKHTGHNRNF